MKSLKALMVMVVFGVLTGLLAGGCATKPEVNWTARVGEYTYDDAVREMGTPARETKLSSGMTVAEWVTGRTPRTGMSFGAGSYAGGGMGMGMRQQVGGGGGGYIEQVLRLTFDPDGVLENWTTSY